MAVIAFYEIYPESGGEAGLVDKDTRVFQAITDRGSDNQYAIRADSRCPRRGTAHSTQSNLFCKTVHVRRDTSVKSPCHWIVKAEYDNQPLSGIPQLAQAVQVDPMLRPLEIEGRSYIGRRARTMGWFIGAFTLAEWNGGEGKTYPAEPSAIQTTAHEAIVGLEEDDPIWIMDCTVNSETIPDWIRTYQGAINDAEVSVRGYSGVFPRWTLMMKAWGHSKLLYEKSPSDAVYAYYSTKFELHYRKRTWVTPIRNEGTLKLVDGDQKQITIGGVRPAIRMLLDKDGALLENPTASSAVYLFHGEGPLADYSIFNLHL